MRCTIYKTFSLAINALLCTGVVFILLFLLRFGYKYYKQHEQKKKEEIGVMIERIIDILQSNVGEEGAENYVVINHVRDMILPVAERKSNYIIHICVYIVNGCFKKSIWGFIKKLHYKRYILLTNSYIIVYLVLNVFSSLILNFLLQ